MSEINVDKCTDRKRDMACCPECDICPYSGFEDVYKCEDIIKHMKVKK